MCRSGIKAKSFLLCRRAHLKLRTNASYNYLSCYGRACMLYLIPVITSYKLFGSWEVCVSIVCSYKSRSTDCTLHSLPSTGHSQDCALLSNCECDRRKSNCSHCFVYMYILCFCVYVHIIIIHVWPINGEWLKAGCL